MIWLQHGFLGFNDWYGTAAQQLAQETNSIVVVPDIFWFDTPLCPGCYLGGEQMREAVAGMFQGSRSALNISANAAGLSGTLPEKFLLTGHSAGGNFATAVGALITQTDQVDNLLGVVMFDGVSRDPLFTDSLTALAGAGIPDYQIAAPPQRWNAFGVATELMQAFYGNEFYGVQIDNGSHTDVIAGNNPFGLLGELLSTIIVKPSPPGGKTAVRTFASGWINDIYAGKGPTDPVYGIYGSPNDGTYVPNQPIVMGQAGATTLPAPPPVTVDPNLPPDQNYLGTWYEQGSVRQFFSIGLVNTKAQYSLNPDGTIRVQNSGNYFTDNGPAVEHRRLGGSGQRVQHPAQCRLLLRHAEQRRTGQLLDPRLRHRLQLGDCQRLVRLQRVHPDPRADHRRHRVPGIAGPGQGAWRVGPDPADPAISDIVGRGDARPADVPASVAV